MKKGRKKGRTRDGRNKDMNEARKGDEEQNEGLVPAHFFTCLPVALFLYILVAHSTFIPLQ